MTQHATTEEILAAYSKLDRPQLASLFNYSRKLISGTSFTEPLDLVHEALHRSLDGRRNWPVGLDFGIYMAKTMQSIVHSERKRMKNVFTQPLSLDVLMELGGEGLPTHCSAEDLAITAENLRITMKAADAARVELADDTDALRVLSGMLAGMSPMEMRESYNLTSKSFDAARHRVMRRIVKDSRMH